MKSLAGNLKQGTAHWAEMVCHVYSNVEVIHFLPAWNRNTNLRRCATRKKFVGVFSELPSWAPPPKNVTSYHATCWWVGCGGPTGKFGEIDTGRLTSGENKCHRFPTTSLRLFLPNVDCWKTKGKSVMHNFRFIFTFSTYRALLHFTLSSHDTLILAPNSHVKAVSWLKEVFPWWNIKNISKQMDGAVSQTKILHNLNCTIQVWLVKQRQIASQMTLGLSQWISWIPQKTPAQVYLEGCGLHVSWAIQCHGCIKKSQKLPVREWCRESLSIVATSGRARWPESAWLTGSLTQGRRLQGKWLTCRVNGCLKVKQMTKKLRDFQKMKKKKTHHHREPSPSVASDLLTHLPALPLFRFLLPAPDCNLEGF